MISFVLVSSLITCLKYKLCQQYSECRNDANILQIYHSLHDTHSGKHDMDQLFYMTNIPEFSKVSFSMYFQ